MLTEEFYREKFNSFEILSKEVVHKVEARATQSGKNTVEDSRYNRLLHEYYIYIGLQKQEKKDKMLSPQN